MAGCSPLFYESEKSRCGNDETENLAFISCYASSSSLIRLDVIKPTKRGLGERTFEGGRLLWRSVSVVLKFMACLDR